MRLFFIALMVAASAVPVAASADDAGVRASVRSYAGCLVRKAPRGARVFVLGEGRNPPRAPDCLPSDVPGFDFAGETERYVIAEALLMADFPVGVSGGAAQVAPADHGARPGSVAERAARAARDPAYRTTLERADAVWSLGVVGDCIARTAPIEAFALVRSEDESPEEAAAIAALKPAIAGCVPVGSMARFTRASLRGPVALYLYRVAATGRR